MILLIDNYDSFSYNLYQLIGELQPDIKVVRNDQYTPEELEEIGYEEYFFGEGVCLIEWPSRIEELIPEDAVRITIEKELSRGFDYRKITVTGGRVDHE